MSAVAAAVVATSVGSQIIGARSADKAADAQRFEQNRALEEQRRQFDKFQELIKPFVEGGTAAFGQQQDFLGLSGADEQQALVSEIENSPAVRALAQQGENAILQNAAATGGLRGGNVQGALAKFRPELLNAFLQQRFGQLGDLARVGQASAVQQGVAGQNFANQAGNIFQNIGEVSAQNRLARGAAMQGILNTGAQAIGGFSGFGGGGGGGASPQAPSAFNGATAQTFGQGFF